MVSLTEEKQIGDQKKMASEGDNLDKTEASGEASEPVSNAVSNESALSTPHAKVPKTLRKKREKRVPSASPGTAELSRRIAQLCVSPAGETEAEKKKRLKKLDKQRVRQKISAGWY